MEHVIPEGGPEVGGDGCNGVDTDGEYEYRGHDSPDFIRAACLFWSFFKVLSQKILLKRILISQRADTELPTLTATFMSYKFDCERVH